MKTNTPRRSQLHRSVSKKQFRVRTAVATRPRWLLILLLLTLPAAVQAQFDYTTVNGTITITGYTGPGGAVVIPDTIDGLPVTLIGYSAFSGNTSLTSVTIPGSVTSIGVYAFASCAGLTSVTIGSGVTSISFGAFKSCTSLSAITVDALNSFYSSVDGALFDKSQTLLIQCPEGKTGSYTISDGVTGIGVYAFWSCTRLTSVTIPGSVTSIGGGAFFDCTNLLAISVDAANPSYSSLDGVLFDKSLITLIQYPSGKAGSYAIPDSVTRIDGAFGGCASLTGVTIPSGVTSIGSMTFNGCTSLASITIPATVTDIGVQAFGLCGSLTNIAIPASVTRISDFTFASCTGLTSVTIPAGVISLGWSAFGGCSSLASVTIPASVGYIGQEAFAYCGNLKAVFFEGNAPGVGCCVFTFLTPVYYLSGATGWGATFAGVPTSLWNPLIQTSGPSFGVQTNRFGFTITGTADIPIVVEASTTLANADWVPLQSLNLTNGAFYFSDANWTNYPARNYRLRSP